MRRRKVSRSFEGVGEVTRSFELVWQNSRQFTLLLSGFPGYRPTWPSEQVRNVLQQLLMSNIRHRGGAKYIIAGGDKSRLPPRGIDRISGAADGHRT